MTGHDLDRIEQALSRPLSPAVRQFFLNYPPDLRGTVRDLGPTPDGEPYTECPADYELCDTADAIVALNDPKAGIMLDDATHRLVLGQGGCGETYWADLTDPGGAVYRFDSGTDPKYSDPVAATLEEFAHGLVASYRAE
jgi:hypothetical protein